MSHPSTNRTLFSINRPFSLSVSICCSAAAAVAYIVWPRPPDKWSTVYPLSGIYPRRFAAIIRYPSPRKDVYPLSRAPALRALNVLSGAYPLSNKKIRAPRDYPLSHIYPCLQNTFIRYPLSGGRGQRADPAQVQNEAVRTAAIVASPGASWPCVAGAEPKVEATLTFRDLSRLIEV